MNDRKGHTQFVFEISIVLLSMLSLCQYIVQIDDYIVAFILTLLTRG